MSVGQALNLLNGQVGSGVKVGVIRRGQSRSGFRRDLVREKLSAGKSRSCRRSRSRHSRASHLTSLDPGRADDVRQAPSKQKSRAFTKWFSICASAAVARRPKPSPSRGCLSRPARSPRCAARPSPRRHVRRTIKGRLEGPVSVLIDGTTSGAAEVLASAMVANKRGDVVGERTFGLASEQKLITMDDGSALFLTVANYYNAAGKPILEDGVEPTEVVRAGAVDDDSDADEDDRKSTPAKVAPTGPRPLSPEDPIFRKALDLLKSSNKKAA